MISFVPEPRFRDLYPRHSAIECRHQLDLLKLDLQLDCVFTRLVDRIQENTSIGFERIEAAGIQVLDQIDSVPWTPFAASGCDHYAKWIRKWVGSKSKETTLDATGKTQMPKFVCLWCFQDLSVSPRPSFILESIDEPLLVFRNRNIRNPTQACCLCISHGGKAF